MLKITFIYAILLIILGAGSYIVSSAASVTALIPAFFGIVILILALLARNENLRRHMMHAVATLSLIAIIATYGGIIALIKSFSSPENVNLMAAWAKSIMALLSLSYLIISIRSFVNARIIKKRT